MEGRNSSISLYLRRNTRKATIQRLMGMGQPHPLQEERHPLQEELKTKMILSHFHGSNVTRRYLNHNHCRFAVMRREEYRSKCTNHGSNVPRSYRILRDV